MALFSKRGSSPCSSWQWLSSAQGGLLIGVYTYSGVIVSLGWPCRMSFFAVSDEMCVFAVPVIVVKLTDED